MDHLIKPYGGELVSLLLPEDLAEQVKTDSEQYAAITLSQRQQCDLELMVCGALSPLTGFMCQQDYESVVENARLKDGTLWPIPYVLDVTAEQAEKLEIGDKLALRDVEGFMPAVLTIESKWTPDKALEAEKIFGTTDTSHPGVDYLMNSSGDVYLGGKVEATQLPFHYDFETLRYSPLEMRQHFDKLGWNSVVAFHTSKPMHAVHYEMTMRASKEINGHILIHPVVGMSKPGDMHYYTRVHCYQALLGHYPKSLVELALIPLAMRMAGPREALMNAIIRQNYGCSHYIVGPEHAAPPNVRDTGNRFYASGSSQAYIEQFKDELDIEVINIKELCYDQSSEKFITREDADATRGNIAEPLSNARILEALLHQEDIPAWATFPEVMAALRQSYPPRARQGLTLFFTGFSGSGKSTLARIIYAKFIEEGKRPVTLLDGDVVRLNLSSELGFSKKDRNTNVRRIGYVASEITKNRGVAICAPIAPYREIRDEVRARIEEYGAFIEIHVSTSIEECEKRDRKGLYAKARKGIIPEFTGISDPYDVPENPEIRVNTQGLTPMQAAQDIYLYLVREGYIE